MVYFGIFEGVQATMAGRYGSGIGTQLVTWQCSQAAERNERCYIRLAFIFHSVQNLSLSIGATHIREGGSLPFIS